MTRQLSFFSILFLLLCKSLFAQVTLPNSNDTKLMQSLNGVWKFKYLPSSKLGEDSSFFLPSVDVQKWSSIKVPSNWELQGFAEPNYGKKLKEGIGLYRTNFTIPKSWKNNPVYICFDGVEFGYYFWVNGKFAGSFASAFNRQVFDISEYILRNQINTIAVKVTTKHKGWEFDTNDDWALSGISRNVTLFSLPVLHIKDAVVQTFVNNNSATIKLNVTAETNSISKEYKNIAITARLLDANGRLVKEFELTTKNNENSIINFNQQVSITKPMLWSAEKPYLYTLQLLLKNGETHLQQSSQKIGIRQVNWANGVLKLNGMPIKLKGVNHHDLSPINGRAITKDEMIRDLRLMKDANVNFIRTSHYPPNETFLELCDSMGLYVMDEVPFGYGDELLTDTSYLPILLQRAKSTIWRDKNHASVIIWSVGNENPVTEIGLQTGRFVKRLDSTRPYCFPQTPTVFWNMYKAMPDSIDILDFHYPKLAELEKLAKILNKPMIASEYTHALGLDFGNQEASYEIMYNNSKLAGGAVWEFMDQGILRKTKKLISKNESTLYVWPTKDSIYDTGENQGTDGVMYADRIPQTDFFHLRKAYTPVKAIDDTLIYNAGKQSFKIKLINRYDFTNLSTVKCKWQLYADAKQIDAGILQLANCNPHDSTTISINTTLPDNPTANYYYLKLIFEDMVKNQFYEKTYLIKQINSNSLLNELSANSKFIPQKNGDSIWISNFKVEFNRNTGAIQIKTKDEKPIITNGLFARVGRKPSMAQDATTTSKRSKLLHSIWTPFLLSAKETNIKEFTNNELFLQQVYKPDSLKDRMLVGDIKYQFTNSGYINILYSLIPNGKDDAVEVGLSFLIPSSFTEFRWIGKGPYAAYPGKERQSEFGIFHLNSNDLYFAGNRQNVDCAVFTDANGNGFAMLANNANIAVERSTNGIIVSHNAHISGTFNKYEWPEDLFSLRKAIIGNFTLIPFTAATYSTVLKNIFGDNKKTVKPFSPYYHSYDQ